MRRFFFSVLFLASIVLLWPACGADDNDFADTRDYISITWRCNESSTLFGNQNYDVTISKGTASETNVFIYNFFDRNTSISAEMDNDVIIIQAIEIDGWTINGSGKVSADFKSINWTYTADDGNGAESFTAIFTVKDPVTAVPDEAMAK